MPLVQTERSGSSSDADRVEVRVAVVGAGEQAVAHLLPALVHLDGVRLSALVEADDTVVDRVGDRFGVSCRFASVEALLGEVAVDAVVAACPPQAHEEIAQVAVEHGVPVFLEKPPAVSTARLGQLAEAAEARGVTTGVGMNMRYAGPYLRIRELLTRPEVGVPVSATVRHVASKPRGSLWDLPPLRSFLLAQAIHPVDLLLNLTGPPTAVETVCLHNGTDTLISVQTQSASGAVGNVLTGTYAPRFESRVEILTDAGVGITLTGLAELTVTGLPAADAAGGSRGWSQQWRPSPLDTGFERTGFQHELRAFLTAAASEVPFTPGLTDLLPTFELLDLVERRAAA